MEFYRTFFKREKSKIILANGSERGCYVPMDYIFNTFGRIHDGIQIMKTYYPSDSMWSPYSKISEHTAKKDVNYAWDYEYEDYDPFDIFSENSSTMRQMRDIKHYGSDIFLTLTLDLSLTDEEIYKIMNTISPYGRIYLRINHESNGGWFRYNLYNSYKQTSDFFVRCHNIAKSVSSNILTVFNLTADIFEKSSEIFDEDLHLESDELRQALEICDYWSIDKYKSLFYGWPFANEVNEKTSFSESIDRWWIAVEECYIKMIYKNKLSAKPLFITEFNADSDVDGYDGQANTIAHIYDRLSHGNLNWIEGIVLYQFRDFGGLGLEKGDLQNFKQLPSLNSYANSINKFKYNIVNECVWKREDFNFTWFDTDNIIGLTIKLTENEKKFINKFDFPIYVTYGEQQCWQRLMQNDSFCCNNMDRFCIAIPPYNDANGQLKYSYMLRNCNEILKDSFINNN